MAKTKPKDRTPTGTRRYTDDILFEVFDLAANGLTKRQIADGFGVTYERLKRWQRRHPLLTLAYNTGKSKRRSNLEMSRDQTGNTKSTTQTITQYVEGRLSDGLKPIWDRLCAFEDDPNPQRRIDALLFDKGTTVRQQLFLHALISKSFKVSQALRCVGISYQVLNSWRGDPQFTELMDEICFHKKNFVEGKLMEAVERGEPWAVTLAIKAVGGEDYKDKQVIKHEGNVDHKHSVKLDQLPLPLRKAVMAALDEHVPDAEVITSRK